ncbi:MAG: Na+/H+ antiporter subunit C [Acidobacteriota bacterium]
MEIGLALTVGLLFAVSFYLLMRRSLAKVIFGLMLFGQAVNLLILTAGRLVRYQAPLIPADGRTPPVPYADPLPQALILTAIVIGFGILGFSVALVYRTYRASGTDHLETGEETR